LRIQFKEIHAHYCTKIAQTEFIQIICNQVKNNIIEGAKDVNISSHNRLLFRCVPSGTNANDNRSEFFSTGGHILNTL